VTQRGLHEARAVADPLAAGAGLALDPAARLLADRLAIDRELGRGGTAVVYLARETATGRAVALKLLRQELAAAVGVPRFLREIEIEGRLNHPHILPIFDSGSVDGRPFYTMPYVEGETLRDRIRRERQLPLPAALSIARAVAGALDHAHSRGVVHRDVKPANILLARDGGVFLADFGIARAMTVATGDQITDSGIFVGTPEYMSPEQAAVKPSLDARSDVYALGCVVYEMLGGEPPFTGPTAQAIVARHCQEPPRSLAVIRPSLGPGVQRVLERALAKVPADRFATPSEMVDALDTALAATEVVATRRSRVAWIAAAASVVALGAVALLPLWGGRADLDANRIVVFPLLDAAVPTEPNGEGIATYLGYALEETRPLRWMPAWAHLNRDERANISALTPSRASEVSRAARAGFFIDGSILRVGDSITVVLQLHSVAGDSVVKTAGFSGMGPAHAIGLRAIAELLPALLASGRHVDLSTLEELKPTAAANFLQGEREYRRMQFAAAIQHYHEALREDSSFALAALRGAEAANWDGRYGDDTAFSAVALRSATRLPPVRALVAGGLHAYLTGAADTSLAQLRRALEIDSTAAPVWTLLGEVYLRMLPSLGSSDSLARNALEHARRADPEFAPALLLLEEIALRDGRVDQVLALREALRNAGADTTHQTLRDLTLRCVRQGAASIDWRDAARRDLRAVQQAGKVLSSGASQAACARSAFQASFQSDTPLLSARWGALLGLQSVLVATGEDRELLSLLSSKSAADLPVWMLYALDAMAGADVRSEAMQMVERRGSSYAAMSSSHLYVLGAWSAHLGDGERLQIIARELHRKADSSHVRRDSLLVRAVDARIPLVKGDTVKAVRLLQSLVPTAPRDQLAWQPWEALGAERLLLAQILYARGRFEDAISVASRLDASEPIAYLLYLRPSLSLRASAARRLGRNDQATVMERRLSKLGVQVPAVPSSPPDPTR